MPRAAPLSDHRGLGRDGPQHRRVLGGVEPADRLHVAYDDIPVVRLGDAVAERLERLDGLLDPLLEHGSRIDPQPEVPAPKARRDAQHVVDFGDRLDVGVGVERHHSVLVPEDGLERLDIAALADPLRCERVAKDVERDQLFVGAHEAVGLRERLERPADIACRREGRARFRQDVAVPDLDRPGKAARAQLPAIGLVNLLQEGEKADRVDGNGPGIMGLGVLDEGTHPLRVRHRVPDRDQARLEIHAAPPKAEDLADSHPRVQGEQDRPLILGGPIESELFSGILFAHDFEKVSRLATKGEA